MNIIMTVGIYIRVSTQEQVQEGYSIAAQKERLTAYCTAQGWDDYKFYIDEGISAKDTNRPKLQLLLNHVEQGSISTILVYRLDRFTRSVSDLYNLLDFLDKHECSFKSATELYDTSSAMGRMFIGLVALLAQWERENLSERVKMGLEEKVSSGERVGNIPFGFDLSEDEKLVKNEKSQLVLEMIEKIKGGWSASRLAKYLNTINHDREWYATGVLRILKNPALYGATRWNDDIYEDTHEGLISKEEFMKIQKILESRTHQTMREVKGNYLFQNKIVCNQCGNKMAVNRFFRTMKDGSQNQYSIYRCNGCYKKGEKQKKIGEQRFLDALYDYMKNIDIPQIEIEQEKDESHFYIDQLKQVEKKREKYQRAWAADLMTDDEFENLMGETKHIINELQKKIDETKTPVLADTEALKNIVFTFNQYFYYLSQDEKRQFIHQFIKKIEYKLIPQPPNRPDKAKKGKDLVVITNVEFF